MAIYKKQKMWSEKDHSYNEKTPVFQRGVIAVRRRSLTGFFIPTTVENVERVALTPLNTTGRTTLKGGYAASTVKVNALASAFGASVIDLLNWSASVTAPRQKDEVFAVKSTKKLYIVMRNITSTNSFAASKYSAAKLDSAIAAGQVTELKQFATTAKNFVPIMTAASAAASAHASVARFAFEVVGWDN